MASDNQKKEIDELSGVETTGHEWDGLKELNNPTPRWWLWLLYITIIWSIGYWIVYPSWPTIDGHTKGTANWTSYKELKESQAEIIARKKEYLDELKNKPFDEIMKSEKLYKFAVAGGSAAFKDNCATCHGTGGQGAKGFPNLNDDDWLWGGSIDDIHTTILYGIRSGHEEARDSAMPAFGRDGLLEREEIEAVAEYVIGLKDGKVANEQGAEIFADNCAACHGDDGKGMRELGAPNLSDAIWLYGGDKETVIKTITNSRSGVMPAWEGRLDEDTIRMLSIYVHSLGGGE